MKLTVWQRMDSLSRQLTPFFLTLSLIIFSSVPYDVPGLVHVMPLFSFIAIFHWGMYRADLLPTSAVFATGLLQDALSGVPMGVYTLIFVLVYHVVLVQQRFFARKSFYVVWLGFALVSAGATILLWALLSLLMGSVIDPRAVSIQYIMGLGFYPIVAYSFLRWQRAFLQQV